MEEMNKGNNDLNNVTGEEVKTTNKFESVEDGGSKINSAEKVENINEAEKKETEGNDSGTERSQAEDGSKYSTKAILNDGLKEPQNKQEELVSNKEEQQESVKPTKAKKLFNGEGLKIPTSAFLTIGVIGLAAYSFGAPIAFLFIALGAGILSPLAAIFSSRTLTETERKEYDELVAKHKEYKRQRANDKKIEKINKKIARISYTVKIAKCNKKLQKYNQKLSKYKKICPIEEQFDNKYIQKLNKKINNITDLLDTYVSVSQSDKINNKIQKITQKLEKYLEKHNYKGQVENNQTEEYIEPVNNSIIEEDDSKKTIAEKNREELKTEDNIKTEKLNTNTSEETVGMNGFYETKNTTLSGSTYESNNNTLSSDLERNSNNFEEYNEVTYDDYEKPKDEETVETISTLTENVNSKTDEGTIKTTISTLTTGYDDYCGGYDFFS